MPNTLKTPFLVMLIGLLVGGGITLLLLFTPIFIWLGWNVLGVGQAVGVGDLSLLGILLASVFCWGGALFRSLLIGGVFLIEPDWFVHGQSASAHWPEPSWSVWFGILLLLIVFLPTHSASDDDS